MSKLESRLKEQKSDLLGNLDVHPPLFYRGSVIEKMPSKAGFDRLGDLVKSGEIALIDISKAVGAKNFIEAIVCCLSVSIPYAGFKAKKALKVGFYSHSMSIPEIKNLMKKADEVTGEKCGDGLFFLSNDLTDEPLFPLTHQKGRQQFGEMIARKCDLIVCDVEPFVHALIAPDLSGYESVAIFLKEMKVAGKTLLIIDSNGNSKNLSMITDTVLEFSRPKKTGRNYRGDELVMTVKKSPQSNMRGQVFTYEVISSIDGRTLWEESLPKLYGSIQPKKRIESVVNSEDDMDEIVVFKQRKQ